MVIDYRKIANSIDFYTANGYKYIEVPWTVPKEAMQVTGTKQETEDNIFPFSGEYLVASAEQSFIHLIQTNQLPTGKYCTATPCFRNDDIDDLHHPYFMKTELIHFSSDIRQHDLFMMMRLAEEFFEKYVDGVDFVSTCNTGFGESFDIEYNDIELGSYGIRDFETIRWIYGTGCAEPRLSSCLGS